MMIAAAAAAVVVVVAPSMVHLSLLATRRADYKELSNC